MVDIEEKEIEWDTPVVYRNVLNLDNDILEAMKKMEEMEDIYASLPHLDSGSCGAPSCRALAEDMVRGFGNETDCIYKLREKVRELAREMMALQEQMPGSFKANNIDGDNQDED